MQLDRTTAISPLGLLVCLVIFMLIAVSAHGQAADESAADEAAAPTEAAPPSAPSDESGDAEGQPPPPVVRQETAPTPGGAGRNAPLAAAADDHLWLVQPDTERDQFFLLHRVSDADDAGLHKMAATSRRPIGMAAFANRVHRIFDDHTVQTITVLPGPRPDIHNYDSFGRRDLPKAARLLDIIAIGDGPVVLLRLDDPVHAVTPKTLKTKPTDAKNDTVSDSAETDPSPSDAADAAADADASSEEPTEEAATTESASEGDTDTAASDEADGSEPAAEPLDAAAEDADEGVTRTDDAQAADLPTSHLRLYVQTTTENLVLPLPEGVTADHLLRLAVLNAEANRFYLFVTGSPAGSVLPEAMTPLNIPAGELHAYTYKPVEEQPGSWQITGPQVYAVSPSASAQVVGVDQQIFLVDQPAETTQLTFHWLRLGQVQTIGEMELPEALLGRWRLVGMGSDPTIVTRDADSAFQIAAYPREGADAEPPTLTALQITEPIPVYMQPQWVMFIVSIVFMVVVLFAYWKRSPRTQMVDLHSHQMIAPLLPRILSALIDMGPPLLIANLIFPTDFDSVFQNPNTAETWSVLAANFTFIAITFAHITVAECITGTSFGKRIFGLYVARLDGGKPTLAQALGRNVSRIFELMIWILLVIPLLNPHRRRLGDVLAQTVVIAIKPEDEENEEDDEQAGQP